MTTVNRLACLLGLMRDFENAEPLFRRAIEGREKVLGVNDPETLKSKQDLGWMFYRKGDFSAAEPLWRGALPGLEKRLGVNHRDTLACAHNLAQIHEHNGKLDEAEKLWQQAFAGSLKLLGATHPTTILFKDSLISVLTKKGDMEKLLELQLETISKREKEPESAGDRQLPIDLNNLGLEFRKIGKGVEAELLLRHALARDKEIRGQSHPKIPHRLNNLCTVLIMQGKLNEAKSLLKSAWQLKSGQHDLTSLRLLFVRLTVALLEAQPAAVFLGQLKTLLADASLPDYADVTKTWNIPDFIGHLNAELGAQNVKFLTALAIATNDHSKISDLDQFPEWRDANPLPLE